MRFIQQKEVSNLRQKEVSSLRQKEASKIQQKEVPHLRREEVSLFLRKKANDRKKRHTCGTLCQNNGMFQTLRILK